MDEKGYRNFLSKKYSNPGTRDNYFTCTMKFQKYQFSRQQDIDSANSSDLRNYKLYLQNKQRAVGNYFYSLAVYFVFKNNTELANLAKKIATELPVSPSYAKSTIAWFDFQNKLLSRKNEISSRDYALLNLLWSEMTTEEISSLSPEDIDFEKATITCRLTNKIYLATNETWDALRAHLIDKDGKKKKDLRFNRSRHAYIDAANNAFQNLGWTLDKIRQSCLSDLYEAGKYSRFKHIAINSELTENLVNVKPKNESPRRSFYNQILVALEQFKARNKVRITQLTQEEQLQRLIEGYLIATFPNEKITPEYRFIGQNIGESKIDFVIGRELIPLEVKFGGRTDVCFNLRLGKGQVLEFLENRHGSKKGILIIGDKDNALESQRNNGFQSNVQVIII